MIVGLTGGIGTGKSTVGKMFKDLGATLVCADELGHQAIHSTGDAFQAIIDRFSPVLPMLIGPDGEINRRALGYHVYLNPGEMEDLEGIVHPIVGRMFEEFCRTNESDDVLIIYECAILFENDIDVWLEPPMTYTIATWCPEEVQISRIMARDRLDRSAVLQRIEKQMRASYKRELADFDIDTSAPDQENRVREIYDMLTKLMPIKKEIRALLKNAKLTDNSQDQQTVMAEPAAPGPLQAFE